MIKDLTPDRWKEICPILTEGLSRIPGYQNCKVFKAKSGLIEIQKGPIIATFDDKNDQLLLRAGCRRNCSIDVALEDMEAMKSIIDEWWETYVEPE